MSSAALQAAPHQPTSVGSHSPIAPASSGRPYTGGSSQSRDGYYTQNAANASPSSARRPTRRPSGNGGPNDPQEAQYYAPSGSSSQPAPIASRNSTSHYPSSPPVTAAAPSGYPTMAPGDHQRGVPPVVSARTSSNRTAAQAAATAADRTRRTAYPTESSSSPRQASGDNQQDRGDRQRSNGNTQVNGEDPAIAAATAATRARRRAQQSPGDAIPHRPSGSREPRASQSASTVARQAAAQSPSGPTREPSAVINRVVVSKPEVDLDRERERMAEAVPSSPLTQTTPGGLALVGDGGVDDGGRGGSRSRHDHGAGSGKREKNSKFGDYYLGNTLGEGEFGKVKMGWKQEGGVQVWVFV